MTLCARSIWRSENFAVLLGAVFARVGQTDFRVSGIETPGDQIRFIPLVFYAPDLSHNPAKDPEARIRLVPWRPGWDRWHVHRSFFK